MYLSVVLLYNIICDRHAQAGTLSHFLGSKKWFEYFFLCILIHSRAVIFHLYKNAFFISAGMNLQYARRSLAMALVDGLDGIGNDVQEYLVELSGVTINGRNITIVLDQLDPVVQQVV